GTGLGEGFLVWDVDHYRVCASEGGHATFAPRTAVEWGLCEHLQRAYGHVSYERVVSGPGLVNVYRFLVERGAPTGERSAALADVEREGAAAVTRHALAGSDPVCVHALQIFISAFGTQAGNLALTVMSTGGVYIGGGVATHVSERMRDGAFVTAFRDKGRLSPLLERMPVHVIVNPNVGLVGAAAVAASL
ncbi:MAG TPA: glucokinase, partial [Gemmatimonadaceae bacterium]|nr:glucokinase [Gemmatimonadaceae bacterium]